MAVRYRQQTPTRRWPSSSVRGTPIAPERLATAFPELAFQTALPTLQQHGRAFHLHRICSKRFTDLHGYVEGMKVEVTTLYCIVLDFEVYLRCTRASEFDPAATQSSSESDTP